MKAMSAVSAVRMLHEGCQCSGWCDEMERQIFMFVYTLVKVCIGGWGRIMKAHGWGYCESVRKDTSHSPQSGPTE